jgi:hypothetical protein
VAPEATQADVNVALSRVPPKWEATVRRFGKTLIASTATAIAVYSVQPEGAVQAIIRDPIGFVIALGTAVVTATWKFLDWKEEEG